MKPHFHRGGCHHGRARDRNDQDAQGPVALVQQLAACAHRRAGIDSRGRCRGFVGIWLRQTSARARRVRGPRQGRRGADRLRGSVALSRGSHSCRGVSLSIADKCPGDCSHDKGAAFDPDNIKIVAVMVGVERVERRYRQDSMKRPPPPSPPTPTCIQPITSHDTRLVCILTQLPISLLPHLWRLVIMQAEA